MMLGNEDFGKIKATIRECLNAGHFLSEFEVQRRRFLLPKHLAEFRAMIEEIEAGDSEDG